METIAKKLRKTTKIMAPYQKIAEELGTNADYVGQIARGVRTPKRGVGLKILKALQKLEKEFSPKNQE